LTPMSSTTKHENKEHNDHSNEILEVNDNWEHARLRCSSKQFSDTCVRVHFVRHGEGHHNVLAKTKGGCSCKTSPSSCPYKEKQIMDARLTELGRQQASANQSFTATLDQLTVIYVSPLSRAVETALLAFHTHHTTNACAFVANENLREQYGAHVCDQRRLVDEITVDYPQVDFSGLKTNEDVLWTVEREPKMSVALRAKAFFDDLKAHHEGGGKGSNEFAVVGHSSFLLTIFHVALDCGDENELKRWFDTGELRTVWVEL
jgi:broad specificity phosphatase PhoE